MKTILAAALTLGLSITAPVAQAQEVVRPAKVFTVAETDSTVRRTYPAIVLPNREADLSFRVSGRVIELPVRGAQQVQAGDVIARLDPRNFERQIAQLESQRDQSAAQLRALRSGARAEEIVALEAAVASAEAQVDQARDQAARTRELAERGVVATARLEQDEATLRVAEANLQAQVEQLAIGQSGGRAEDIEAAEAALRGLEAQLQVARDNLADATLTAPFDGIIASRNIENFVNIQAGQSVALLQSLGVLDLEFDIPGPDVTALTAGGVENIRNQVAFDALPDMLFDAEVVEFSVQADRATQTYRGRVSLPQPDSRSLILPGMVGRVISTAPGDAPEIEAPLTAIASDAGGSPFVWRVEDGNIVTQVPVTLGAARGDMVAVSSGLQPGDTIVSAGVSQLFDGMVIRPITRVGN
ncbi:MAG: efflux RND transporter periplasmic adaptor subunit [Pseudomonadota bacterium]